MLLQLGTAPLSVDRILYPPSFLCICLCPFLPFLPSCLRNGAQQDLSFQASTQEGDASLSVVSSWLHLRFLGSLSFSLRTCASSSGRSYCPCLCLQLDLFLSLYQIAPRNGREDRKPPVYAEEYPYIPWNTVAFLMVKSLCILGSRSKLMKERFILPVYGTERRRVPHTKFLAAI